MLPSVQPILTILKFFFDLLSLRRQHNNNHNLHVQQYDVHDFLPVISAIIQQLYNLANLILNHPKVRNKTIKPHILIKRLHGYR